MTQSTIKNLPKGEYVKRKPESKKVYIRGDYCRESKRYELRDADDISLSIFVKGSVIVEYGFTY